MHATIDYSPEKAENAYKPGPGTYDPDALHVKRSEPQYKLGTGVRLDLGLRQRQQYQ